MRHLRCRFDSFSLASESHMIRREFTSHFKRRDQG